MNPVFILYSYHIYDTILFFTIITGFSYYLLSSIYKKRKSDLIYLSIFIILLFLIRHTYSFLWLSLITIVFCKIYGYKIIKYFFIPLLVISIFQFKNFYFIGQAHYGAPYEVLNENLSFLKKIITMRIVKYSKCYLNQRSIIMISLVNTKCLI